MKLVLVPDALEDEDMLEMMNAGLLQAIVVDDWKAKLWAQVLPKIQVHEDIVRASRHEEGLGDPQGQPETRRRAQRFLHEVGEEAGRDSLPSDSST